MRDVIFIAVIVAFFALSAGLVWFCERIIGGDELVVIETPTASDPLEAAA